MLHYNTATEELLELLKTLQSIPEFSKLRLVGGTSLALQIGHRKSIDLDLFGKLEIDSHNISQILARIGPTIKIYESKNIYIFSVNNIKVDFVNYTYNWLDKCLIENRLNLATKADIAAMKLNAISGRGTKKDFVDLYFLLQTYTLDQLLGFYEKKYPDGSLFLVLKSLSYFADAELDVMPFMIQNIEWKAIKKAIINKTREYLNKI